MALAERSAPGDRDDAGGGTCGAGGSVPGLARWRAQPPFGERRWWLERLSAGGLTESSLSALLAEADADLAGRTVPPPWTAELAGAERGDWDAGADDQEADGTWFTAVAGSMLSRARGRLESRLREISGAGHGPPVFDPGLLAAELYAPLPATVDRMVLRTLVLELDRARRDGELRSADARDRFAEFVRMLGEERYRVSLFARYPVLARQLAVEVRAWLDGCARFAAHLAADHARIAEEFGGGAVGALGAVERVRPGLGDRHRSGSVASVRWSSGLELVYKPRPLALEAHFRELLTWVNGKGLSCALRGPRCLEGGDHGWAEFIPARPCAQEAERRRFYRRQGSLLMLLYVLGGNDIHAENVIASGEYPVLVDLETLLQPGLPRDEAALTAAEAAAAEAARSSVLTAGLLPRRVAGAGGGPVDVSGLGYTPGQPTWLPVPVVRDAGTDTMRVDLAPKVMGVPAHRPVAGDAPLPVLDYAGEVLAGFSEAYQLCQVHRDELGYGPLAGFGRDEVRVVVRPTVWYATILQTGFHPEVLRDGLDRERHFDALWRQAPDSAVLAACAEHERADLWHNDIPVFTTTASGAVLLDSGCRPVKGLALEPGISRARARLAGLGPQDLARQRWLITSSLATMAPAGDPAAMPSGAALPAPDGTDTVADRDDLLTAASAVGQRLARLALRADGSAQWLGVNSTQDTIWSVGPVKADLYHGLSGIALFLAFLGSLTGDDSHTVLAREALRTARRQLGRGMLRRLGMAGNGGIVYALCELGRLWNTGELLDEAEEYAQHTAGQAHGDTVCDFIGGVAGTIAGLAVLHELRPSDRLRHQIQVCADRLLATSISTDHGIGWLPSTMRERTGATLPAAGFAHGNAGVIPSLLAAADILGDPRYRQAAGQALAYEQSLPAPPEPGSGWCYGATGIGLSRLLCLAHGVTGPASEAEIDSALTVVTGNPASTHCLCHGRAGNLELYLHAASLRGEPAWQRAAARHAASILADISTRGWKCGTPLRTETPGLLIGLAGIGHGLLRAAEPGRVPPVLTLQPAAALPGPSGIMRRGPGSSPRRVRRATPCVRRWPCRRGWW
jgi:type 2 lantibiotic biosynthesis protein LanM